MSFQRIMRSRRGFSLGQAPGSFTLPPQGGIACPSGAGYDVRLIEDPSQVVASGIPLQQAQYTQALHIVNQDDPRCSGLQMDFETGQPIYPGGMPGSPGMESLMVQPQGGGLLAPGGLPQGGQTVMISQESLRSVSAGGYPAGWAQTYRPGAPGAGGEVTRGPSILEDEAEGTEQPGTAGKLLAVGGMGAGVLVAALLASGTLGD